MRRVVIVGGGFSGSAVAVQLVRRSPVALDITVIEPRARIGGGLAYGSDEPDHRLNGQPGMHSVDPTDLGMFARWCEESGAFAADPGARLADGTSFMRRATFRAFLEDTVRRHAAWPTGSSIRHLQDSAVDVAPDALGMTVLTADGSAVACDLVVLACGHARARLPANFASGLSDHPRVIADPLAAPRLPAVPATDRVLIVGSGLTAYDAASTLLSAGHHGAIDMVSRRGLRPRPQRPPPAPGVPPAPPMLERVAAQPEQFILDVGHPATVRALLRAVRRRIREAGREGKTWDDAFDHLRDMAAQVWPPLAVAEKRRFFRQLRTWYDVHRFRVPPQNSAIVHAAEQRGQVRLRASSIQSVETVGAGAPLRVALRLRGAAGVEVGHYDRVINCTGVDATHAADVPLFAALLARGLVSTDPSGVGLAVDGHCRALGRDARAADRLCIVGPPTLGARGDPLGSAFIAIQIHHMIAHVMQYAPGGDQ